MKSYKLFLTLCVVRTFLLAEPTLALAHGEEGVSVEWTDNSISWNLLKSPNLEEWEYVDKASFYAGSGSAECAYEVPASAVAEQEFYRLRKHGEDRLFVIGDSISVWSNWPKNLAETTGLPTFSQAIGGTFSPSMVSRRDGVELAYPLIGSDTIAAGTVQLRLHRYVADLSDNAAFRSKWGEFAKAVSEPETIEVFQFGEFVGLAQKEWKVFSTDYANDPKTVSCVGHGLSDGDRVVFISDDSNYPDDITVLDSSATWRYSSPLLPSAVTERRVYYVANSTADSFEVKEFINDSATLDLGGDSTGANFVECGWTADIEYDGATWDVTWRVRTKYDDWIWLLEVSANDIPKTWTPAATVTIPNTEALLDQMLELEPRYILVCPPSGSNSDRGPGSYNWTNYYDVYMPLVLANHPDNHVDTMTVLGALRTQAELDLLDDPLVPELLWISGSPSDDTTWVASDSTYSGASQMWVGPGYVPLQFRASFSDGIHLGPAGNVALAAAVADVLAAKGWWTAP